MGIQLVNFQSCPDNHEVFIFMGSIDRGDAVKVGRYNVALRNCKQERFKPQTSQN